MKSETNNCYRLGFIGGGKLAGSVMRGLVRANFCLPGESWWLSLTMSARKSLGEDLGISLAAENAEVAEKAEVILIGVKPGVVLPVVEEIAAATKDKLVISLAAGVGVTSMEEKGAARFLRAMTNTPAGVCRPRRRSRVGARTTDFDVSRAREIFLAIGTVVEVEERLIDAVTALAGSGPAFVYTDDRSTGGRRH